MTPTFRLLALAAVPMLALAACGGDDTTEPAGAPVTTPAPSEPAAPGDATTLPPGAVDIGAALRRAASLLGTAEDALPDDVRIARRGDEQFALTMDLVPGRLTVELDEDEAGQFVVTSVVVETEEGQEVVTVERLLEDARSYLGTAEPGLDPHWRIARRGDGRFALTEDFVVGRFTVELDDDGTGAFVVTAVTVELPDGEQRVTAEG